MVKELFDVTGMSCSACSSRVEKSVARLEGVGGVSVNLLKNSMSVTFDENVLDADKIIDRVKKIGYGAALHKQAAVKKEETKPSDAAGAERQQMKKRLIVSLVFTVSLFGNARKELL